MTDEELDLYEPAIERFQRVCWFARAMGYSSIEVVVKDGRELFGYQEPGSPPSAPFLRVEGRSRMWNLDAVVPAVPYRRPPWETGRKVPRPGWLDASGEDGDYDA